VIEFLKGKSAIARLSGKERNFSGEHFWARGYAVSTLRIRIGAGLHLHPRAGCGRWSRRTILNQSIRGATRDALTLSPTAFEAAQLIKPPASRGCLT
jgi:hypothetical protein